MMLKKLLFETRFGEWFLEILERRFDLVIIEAGDVDYLMSGYLAEAE